MVSFNHDLSYFTKDLFCEQVNILLFFLSIFFIFTV